jgi:hypothetical protein
MSLGYFYETDKGMTPDEASNVYGHIKEEIDKRLPIFPYNFSMSDGLLYLDNFLKDDQKVVVKEFHSEVV